MRIQVPLGSSTQLLRVTAEQLTAMVELGAFADLKRIELRDGFICQLDLQSQLHLQTKSAVYQRLCDALRPLNSPLGVSTDGSLRLDELEVPMPDVFVWEVHWGSGPVPVEHVRLIVEISTTTLENYLGRKRKIYAARNIPEYWVVDLDEGVVRQYWSPEGVNYSNEMIVLFGQQLSAATLPDVGIDTTVFITRG